MVSKNIGNTHARRVLPIHDTLQCGKDGCTELCKRVILLTRSTADTQAADDHAVNDERDTAAKGDDLIEILQPKEGAARLNQFGPVL